MKVEYEFDKAKMQKLGFSYEQAVIVVKQAHAERNFPCLSDGEILAFCDNDSRHDYSNLWLIMDRLVNTN